MPLQRCGEGGKGWRWGDSGKCYTGPGAKKKAIKQGLAIEGPDKFASKATNEEVDILLSDTEISLGIRTHISLVRGGQSWGKG